MFDPLSLVASVAGPLISGIMGRNDTAAANYQSFEMAQLDREYQNRVRKNERTWFNRDLNKQKKYARQLTLDDREHANSVLQDERRYQENKARQDRAYARDVLLDERDYAAGITASDRRYAEKTRRQDRQYMDRKRDQDIAQYTKDRNFMQQRSNKLANMTAASRGIDFQKLRDDAIAAGYNPMTALSMAHAYSTERNYALQGGVYSPGANYTAAGPGYVASSTSAAGGGAGSGGGGAAPGAVVGSHGVAAGSFQPSGAGYQSNFQPQMASSGFIAEAMDRAVDTVFNQPVESDPLADALRTALRTKRTVQSVQEENFSQDFGYDLTKQEAFKPAMSVGVPPLRNDQKQVLRPVKSLRPPRDPRSTRKMIPVVNPFGQESMVDATIARRLDIKKWDTVSAGDWPELVGEVPGEAENALRANDLRGTATGENLNEMVLSGFGLGPSVDYSTRDYLESGITGQKILSRDPSPSAGWWDEYFN